MIPNPNRLTSAIEFTGLETYSSGVSTPLLGLLNFKYLRSFETFSSNSIVKVSKFKKNLSSFFTSFESSFTEENISLSGFLHILGLMVNMKII